jgi:hypothetical protein
MTDSTLLRKPIYSPLGFWLPSNKFGFKKDQDILSRSSSLHLIFLFRNSFFISIYQKGHRQCPCLLVLN